jgi:hypothetical protein
VSLARRQLVAERGKRALAIVGVALSVTPPAAPGPPDA